MTPVLTGYRVVELSQGFSSAIAGGLLAANGADLIRIELAGNVACEDPPGSRVWNRGKRSMTLDLRSQDGAAAFRRLLGTADVLLAESI